LVDIIIVNYNTRELIERCLIKIAHYTNLPYRVYVVDNGSTDGSLEYLRGQSWIRLIEAGTNLGYGRACNLAIRRGRGEHIVCLNSDIEVTPNWLEPLVVCLDSDPKIAVVGPKCIDHDGLIKGAGFTGTYRKLYYRGWNEPDGPGKFDRQEDVLAVSGAAFAIKRSLIPELGLFDERYFFYYEDVDYCTNAREKGYRVVYCPYSIIYHHHMGSCRDEQRIHQMLQDHKVIYETKWQYLMRPKLTWMMLVRNEANRYLKRVLDDASEYVDEFVIVDDNSTDGTFELCSRYEKVKILERVSEGSYAANELATRLQVYNLTLSTFPDWILAMDGDEVFEKPFKDKVRDLIATEDFYWYSFIFCNFYNSERYYRVDGLWKPDLWMGGIRLYRHLPDYHYIWNNRPLHCGSIPINIYACMPGAFTNFRIKHYGYAGDLDDIRAKYQRYITLDPEGLYCPRWHYDSIVSTDMALREWVE